VLAMFHDPAPGAFQQYMATRYILKVLSMVPS